MKTNIYVFLPTMSAISLNDAQAALASANVNAADLFLHILSSPNSTAFAQISSSLQPLLSAIYNSPFLSEQAFASGHKLMKPLYAQAITELTKKEHGWHFNALRATPEQLRDYKVEDMAKKMQTVAPELWELIGMLLGAPDPEASFSVLCGEYFPLNNRRFLREILTTKRK